MKAVTKCLFVIMVLCGVISCDVFAEEALTWHDCVIEALESHPDLIASRQKLVQSEEDKDITESGLLPQISTEASGGRSQSGKARPANKYTYGLSAQQLLFDGFKTASDVSSAVREMNAAQYDYYVTSSDVRLRLRVAFVEFLRANALLEVTRNIAERRRQNLDLVQLLYNAGREHKGSLAVTRADLSQAELDIIEAERSIKLSRRRLLKELGRSKYEALNIEGSLEEKNRNRMEPDFEVLAESTPFLNELIQKKEASRFEVRSAKAELYFPKVYADGALGKNDNKILPSETDWSFGLKFSYPLYEGGERIAQVKKAEAKLYQTEADERSGRDDVIYTLQEAWTEWQNAMDNVSVKLEYLEATKLRAEITQAEYKNGLALFDNWTIIEDELSNSKKSYLNSLADTLIAEAYWIQAKGGILEDA